MPYRFSPGIVLFVVDVTLSVLSLFLAFYLRFDGVIPADRILMFYKVLPLVCFARATCYFGFGFYARLWEHASLHDLAQIVKAVILGSGLFIVGLYFYDRLLYVPRSVLAIDAVLLIFILGGSRLGWRLWKELKKRKHFVDNKVSVKVIIFGAGFYGAGLLKQIRNFPIDYSVVGFIDDNPRKLNKTLMGVEIIGARKDIPRIAKKLNVKTILVAIGDISPDNLREIDSLCKQGNLNCRVVESAINLSTNELYIKTLKNIRTNDLLGRSSISLDMSMIRTMISGKRVLVTGAGGSIGSELCNYILEYEPSSLVMLDQVENNLYDLELSLVAKKNKGILHYVLGSVRNQKKMHSVFEEHRPQLVFHAAAHKHVPLMESNIIEAFSNNIFGTKLVAEMSMKWKVEKFVLISTDKAVDPSNIMGITKKIAENQIRFLDQQTSSHFVIVRFGNVLGSRGSVVPLFEKQIEQGGPITVTHPEMTRYFMTIPEAVQLLLQAASIGTGGEIFLLDMGKPMKIVDMARRMIEYSGLIPEVDIKIEFIGVRPGEKMHEQLLGLNEKLEKTFHEKIHRITSGSAPGENYGNRVERFLSELESLPHKQLRENARGLLSYDSAQ